MKHYRTAIAMFVIALIGATAWRWFCTPCADDFIYSLATVDSPGYDLWDRQGESLQHWSQVGPTVWHHVLTQNSRLSNILAYVYAVTPRPMWMVAFGLCVAMLPVTLLWAAGGRRLLRCGPTVVAAYFLMWVVLPWEDYLQSYDFFLNYVPPSVLALGVMVLWRSRRGPVWAAVAAAFLLGWWHEGFGVPVGVWMAVDAWQHRRASRRQWLMLCGVAAGTLLLVPGVWGRLMLEADGMAQGRTDRAAHLSRVLTCLLTPIVLYAVAAIRYFRHDRRLRSMLPLLAAVAVAVAEGMVVGREGRTLWPAALLGLAGLMDVWAHRRCLRPTSHRLRMVVTCGGVALYALFSGELVYWQHVVAQEQPLFVDGRVDLSTHVYFSDVRSRQLPWWTLGVVRNDYLWHRNKHGAVLLDQWGAYNVILPQELEQRDFDQWPKVVGDNPFRGTVHALLARDTTDVRDVTIHYGAPTRSTPPWWAVPYWMGLSADSKQVRGFWSGPYVHRGDTLWCFVPSLTGRTLRTRQIQKIDCVR